MEEIIIQILNNAFVVSFLIIAIVIVRICFKNMPKWIVCLLWLAVAIRLAIPINIESSFGLIPTMQNIQLSSLVSEDDVLNEVSLNDESFDVSKIENHIEDDGDEDFNIRNKKYQSSNSIDSILKDKNIEQQTSGLETKFSKWIIYVWIFGIVIMLLYAEISYVFLKGKVSVAKKMENNIYEYEYISDPFIVGIVSPRIYLPVNLPFELKEYVLKHEEMHIRRKDYIWKPLGFLFLSVYWFHPLCWIAYTLFCKDIECACDESALMSESEEWKINYCQALLECSKKTKMVAACPVAFGEDSVKTRIKNILYNKKPTAFVMLMSFALCIILIVCFGTNRKITNNSLASSSLNEIRKEAKDFSYKCNSFEISEQQIYLPESDSMQTVSFLVASDTPDDIEQKFMENLKTLMKTDTVNRSLINYYLLKDGKYEIVQMDKATKVQKTEKNAYLIYFDGRYQEILYKPSMMCELGDNAVPSQYVEDVDFSSQWTHMGLDLGTLVESYEINDDFKDVTYNLADGECSIKKAIDFVEKQIKNTYNFVGSDILEYSVYQVDVRKLKENVYYYQFKVKAEYQGVTFDKDEAIYENKNINAESHIVSMFQNQEIGYIWSCCHAYNKIVSREKVDEMISLHDACTLLEKEITAKRKFDIESVELLYLTEFIYDKKDIAVDKVKAYPVYHFFVKNPNLAGYSTLCFEVNALTGEVVVGK